MAVDAQCRPELEHHRRPPAHRRAEAAQIRGDEHGEERFGAQRVDRLSRETGVTIDLGGGNAGDILADPLSLAGQGVA